ncbi:MAG: hypothetical protein P8M78_14750, partial [Myxococcota bacterium]|nr:hypothetical protein [Myxococcota bacterium]
MDLENSFALEPTPWSPLAGPASFDSDTALFGVLASGILAVLFLYLPLAIRLSRVGRLQRLLKRAQAASENPAENLRAEIALAFEQSPLAAQWESFSARWRSSQALGESDRAAVRLIDIFDDQPLLATGAVKNLLPALPGLFMAVGVLGTLVGFASAVGTPAPSSLEASGEVLTAQIAGALRCGVWGLILSIGAVILSRSVEGRFDRLAESLDRIVESAFPAVSSGELSSQSARAQHEVLSELSHELKHFGSDLTERIDRGLLRIEQSTASAASLVTEQQRGALQNVVQELSLQVQSGVEQHLSSLHDVLERAVDHQGTVTGGLAEAFDIMNENAQVHARVTQTLEDTSNSVQEAAHSISTTAREFAPVLENLKVTGNALSETSSTTRDTQEVVAQSAQGIHEAMEQGQAALFEQRQFIEASLDEIRSTVERLSTGLGENLHRALRDVDDALEHTVGRLRDTLEESHHTIDRLASPMRAAEGTTREMQVALERARDEVLALGEWLGESIRPLKSNLGQLEDRASDITRSLTRFGDHTAHVDKTMDALRGEIHEESRRFRASTAELNRNLQQVAEAARRQAEGPSQLSRTTAPAPSSSSPSFPNRAPERAQRTSSPLPASLSTATHPGAAKSPPREEATPPTLRQDSGWTPVSPPAGGARSQRTPASEPTGQGRPAPSGLQPSTGKILGP